jgi:hypothetical protein
MNIKIAHSDRFGPVEIKGTGESGACALHFALFSRRSDVADHFGGNNV